MKSYDNKKLSTDLSIDVQDAVSKFIGAETAADIAELLEVPIGQLAYILYTVPEDKRYRQFYIPKKTGGQRLISAPNRSIDILQRKIKPILDELISVRKDVHGLSGKRNIVTNAKRHKKQRYILNIDLKNFYPTVNFARVRGAFQAGPFNLGSRAATIVAQILCYKGGLPQGACTSAIMANHIVRRLDYQLSNHCRKSKCRYSRYADDITISSNLSKFPASIAAYDDTSPLLGQILPSKKVKNLVTASGFAINNKKTRLLIRSCRQDVTGITINDFPNIPRRFINRTKAIIHGWRKYGISKASKHAVKYFDKAAQYDGKALEGYFKSMVYGRIAYVKMVRGEHDIVFRKLASELANLDSSCPEYLKKYKNMKMQYDVFIGHASEDKTSVAIPLKDALEDVGVSSFIDIDEILWGDSLSEKINHALASSNYFIAIMSGSSIKKSWPMKEVHSALSREIEGKQRFLPLIVGDENTVLDAFPLIKEKLYFTWDGDGATLAKSVKKIKEAASLA